MVKKHLIPTNTQQDTTTTTQQDTTTTTQQDTTTTTQQDTTTTTILVNVILTLLSFFRKIQTTNNVKVTTQKIWKYAGQWRNDN